ncbi:MAG: preprotein translocase subunit SecE [Firmicutes bacterium]|nr:preprotein translocase subunit SecE [Bacillota bacterium]
MANELEKKAQKEAEKAKRERQYAAMKAAAAKKPKKSPIQYFKDVKSEFKKVSWPTRKQVFNNTVVVLVSIVVSGLGVWVIDFLFSTLRSLMLSN